MDVDIDEVSIERESATSINFVDGSGDIIDEMKIVIGQNISEENRVVARSWPENRSDVDISAIADAIDGIEYMEVNDSLYRREVLVENNCNSLGLEDVWVTDGFDPRVVVFDYSGGHAAGVIERVFELEPLSHFHIDRMYKHANGLHTIVYGDEEQNLDVVDYDSRGFAEFETDRWLDDLIF